MSVADGAPRLTRHVSFAIAAILLSGLVSAVVLLRLSQVSAALTDLTRQTRSQPLLSADTSLLNGHIDKRIGRYVTRQKQARIDSQYQPYALAADHPNPDSHLYGSDQARFTLIEFADIECGYCRRYHDVLKTLVDASEGRVNWQWRHLPLGSHNPAAMVQAQASECVARQAGNRAFWVYLHALFAETRGNGQGAGDLAGLAEGIGIDPGPLIACVDHRVTHDRVLQDIAQARSQGISSTPVTVVVDNHSGQQVIMSGLQNPDALVLAIRRLAARS